MTRLETARLILRPWEPRDHAPFAALNADPEVMEHFPKPLTRSESDAQIGRFDDRRKAEGFSFAVAQRKSDGAFLGMVGISPIRFPEVPPLRDAVEVGWRLAREHWGQGYATEAARAWLDHGFGALGLSEIVAFTVPANLRSQAVMRRLGMRHDPARDFLHPALSEGHPLRPMVLFVVRPGAT